MLLQCDALTKSFGGVPVLRGITFGVERGRTLGVAGENGAGKSTLMNLIGGVHRPDSGSMTWNGAPYAPANPLEAQRHGLAIVHQELNLFSNLSITDNLFLIEPPLRGGWLLDAKTANARAKELMTRVGLTVDPSTPVELLAPGDRQLVEIAKALRSEAQMVILDEPTTSLTPREIDRLFSLVAELKSQAISILYISHSLQHLLSLCDDILVLRDGSVVDHGPAATFDEDRLVVSMIGRSVTQLFPHRSTGELGQVVLEAREVSEPGVVERVSFAVHSGEILGIAGQMGSGRTELARILFGLDSAASGSVLVSGESVDHLPLRERIGKGMAYLTESRRDDGLFMDATVAENMRIVHPDDANVSNLIASLRIVCADPERQPVSQLSGGNQQKTVLAKWLARKPKVLILDEPTRGIDVGAKQEIYSLLVKLAAEGMALIVISSEIEELLGLCHRILVMAKGEIRGEFDASEGREAMMRVGL